MKKFTMDRFEYIEARLAEGEIYLKRDKHVKIYDGNDKTQFIDGEVVLTSHRIFWGKPGDIPKGLRCLVLNLYYVICREDVFGNPFSFGKLKGFILYLTPPATGKLPGPSVMSLYNYVKFTFKDGLDQEFVTALETALAQKAWLQPTTTLSPSQERVKSKESSSPSKMRLGIAGIERSIEEKHKSTDQSIQVAFQDLKKLMEKAKDMVLISKAISTKIKEKQGDITEDDTIRFKSYLMSLGIDDPVTRDTFRSDSDYYRGLAQQISDLMVSVLLDSGGMMSLADVWCRVNRARGLELISPDDLLNACKLLQTIGAPMSLRKFPSGACVLQLNEHHDDEVAKSTSELIERSGSLTPEKLSGLMNISIVLARERLFTTERFGLACRDESIGGLEFYPNLFLFSTAINVFSFVCRDCLYINLYPV